MICVMDVAGEPGHHPAIAPPGPPRAGLAHRALRMTGRDPHEEDRASTPLELLFDLTFVVAVGQAASQLAHEVFIGHVGPGVIAFAFVAFAVSWAWVNFSWFASAFDTDDWVFRVMTMVQMVGVCILALGVPRLFTSIVAGGQVDNKIMVLGYVVMRLAMVSQWLRAALQSPERRAVCRTYAINIVLAQAGWIILAFLPLDLAPTLLGVAVLVTVEFLGPYTAEKKDGGTPWHAHHIAERYSLFAIISLGEGVVGTVAALSSAEEVSGLGADVVLLGAAGIGLTFGMWWTYFTIPSAQVLHVHREHGFVWGYGHIVLFAAIIATGAGLHVAALQLEAGHAADAQAHGVGELGAVLAVALPVGLYILSVFLLYAALVRRFDPWHYLLIAGTAVVLIAAVLLAVAGVPMSVCLLVVMGAPLVTVVGYESVGHRHESEALARIGVT